MAVSLFSPILRKSVPEFTHTSALGFSPYSNKLEEKESPMCCISNKFSTISQIKRILPDGVKEKNRSSTSWNHYTLFSHYSCPHPGIRIALKCTADQSLIADATRKCIAWKRQTIRKDRTQSHWPKSRPSLGYGSRVAGRSQHDLTMLCLARRNVNC